MFSISTTMTAAVERGMRSASVEFASEVIGQLHSEGVLKCSLDDALKMFDFDSVKVVSSRSKASKKRESGKSSKVKKVSVKITAKPAVVLPFCGEIQGDWCNGVKFSHGLHTQCTMGPSGEDTYCKTCRKHADNSATGKPPYGDINDRAEFNVDYRDPKGKLTLPYANVVEKLGISMEAAVAAAATLGWTIPAEQLVKRTSKRGRPAKSAAVSDSDSDTEETKKRGRPSKAKVAAPTQEDQIAQLVAEAYAETTTKSAVKVKKVKKLKVKKPKLTDEQKASVKLAKKEAADKFKAEKKEAADQLKAEKKEAADKLKAEKKEAADQLKAEKKEAADQLKAEKAAANLAKKEAALKVKEEKLVAKALEKEAKEAAALKLKSEKKALALKVRQEKAAAKKAERDAAKLRKKEAADKLKAEKAEETVVEFPELEEEVILEESDIAELEVDSSDDEEADEGETELSETMTVGGVEYFFSEMDGQTILFSKGGEPVGIYDATTDTVQECEFDDE